MRENKLHIFKNVLKASHVSVLIIYHLVRYVLLGEHDDRMIELIHTLSKRSPMYVKIFQALAGSSGFLSQTVQDYLAVFSDNVPYNSDDLRTDYLKERVAIVGDICPEVRISQISDEPIHSGTVSLVYDGLIGTTPVVIKCVRRGVKEKMINAFEEAEYVIKTLNMIPSIKALNLGCVLGENKQLLLEQISMTHELSNLMQLREKTNNRDYIVIPEPYPVFTDTNDDILVMKKLQGKRVDEINTTEEKESYGLILAKQSMDAILTDGIYHGDLHRGNILFMEEDGVKKIGIIDFGIMGKLSQNEQMILSSFYLSIGMGNYEDVVNSLIGTMTNKDILDAMLKEKREQIILELATLTEDACTSREGFKAQHMTQINRIFTKNGLTLAPIFCRIELALAMNASVSKSLETKDKNFMTYLRDVITSRMDMSVFDV